MTTAMGAVLLRKRRGQAGTVVRMMSFIMSEGSVSPSSFSLNRVHLLRRDTECTKGCAETAATGTHHDAKLLTAPQGTAVHIA